jgi:hypothetical protein
MAYNTEGDSLNHRFWITFIFEFLPTFFAIRRLIRERADEDYNILSLAWCSLSRLFLFTNKTNYLQVYVDFRTDEVERSDGDCHGEIRIPWHMLAKVERTLSTNSTTSSNPYYSES